MGESIRPGDGTCLENRRASRPWGFDSLTLRSLERWRFLQLDGERDIMLRFERKVPGSIPGRAAQHNDV